MTSPVRFRQVQTTTTVQIRPAGTKPVISARSVVSQRRQRITADQAKDPEELAKSINFVQEDAARATDSLRNEPMIGSLVVKGVAVVGSVPFTLTHNMGHAVTGYVVTRCYAGSGTPMTLIDGTLPAGLSALQAVTLIPSSSGTIDVRVW